MNIIYKRIFNLVLGHDYFVDGFDRFVNVRPTVETENKLSDGKMLFKTLPHGVTLLYRALDDETTPFVDLGQDQLFTFVLNSGNIAGLQNITNLDESPSKPYKTGNILYFKNIPANASSNKNNPEILSYEIIDTLRSRAFNYQFTLTGNPATVKLVVTDAKGTPVSVGKDGSGNPLPTTLPVSIRSNNTFEQQIDLSTFTKGRFLITILNDAETLTLKEEKIYADELLEKQNILGIAEIIYEAGTSQLYASTEAYKIQFSKANSTWKYFIVNKSKNIDLSTDSLAIADNGSVNGSPYSINSFSRSFASIRLTAKTAGTAGNSITLAYSGGGSFPALSLSGETLSGGTTGVEAKGSVTVVNNSVTAYTLNIGGVDFTEGADFSNGATPADTATNLISAINGNGSVEVTAASLGYDLLVNNLETLVFNSDQAIPFFEKPKLNIELQQTSNNQKIIANLQNPSHGGIKKSFAGRLESEVYIFI
jgi:hypothetical protein